MAQVHEHVAYTLKLSVAEFLMVNRALRGDLPALEREDARHLACDLQLQRVAAHDGRTREIDKLRDALSVAALEGEE